MNSAKVDLCFLVKGEFVKRDHSYPLFGAISRIMPSVHKDNDIAIVPINGIPEKGKLRINDDSRLIIRVPQNDRCQYLSLVGETLNIDGDLVKLGKLDFVEIFPKTMLSSRMVVIKGYMEWESFLESVKKKLVEMNIDGSPALVLRSDEVKSGEEAVVRRVVRIKGKTVVGYPVFVNRLSAKDSYRLQEEGLGGRRHFGCGIFT